MPEQLPYAEFMAPCLTSFAEGEREMPANENASSNSENQDAAQESATTSSSSAESGSQSIVPRDGQLALTGSTSESSTGEFDNSTSALVISPGRESHEPTSSDATESFRKSRRKRVRLGEALRKRGIDEHAVAAGYADAMGELQSKPRDSNAGKLLVDILKQCGKILEEEDAPGKPESDAHAVPVAVIRNMLRPQRGPGQGGDKSGSRS
jgi:hypothetical protein